MPPVDDFQPDDDIKSNLRIEDRNKYFAKAAGGVPRRLRGRNCATR